jgi:hypothetical protein
LANSAALIPNMALAPAEYTVTGSQHSINATLAPPPVLGFPDEHLGGSAVAADPDHP